MPALSYEKQKHTTLYYICNSDRFSYLLWEGLQRGQRRGKHGNRNKDHSTIGCGFCFYGSLLSAYALKSRIRFIHPTP